MKRIAQSVLRNSEGAVAPTVALSLVGLIAIGGIAFDYSRMATLDTELQNAADQAALAAASQLDGKSGACERAIAAATGIVSNRTLLANDSGGLDVTIAASTVCEADGIEITDATGASIRFFLDKAATTPADTVADANFVEVIVDSRRANYALTPIVGALTSGDLSARARAGLGTALCKVPPLMICNPTPGVAVDWDAQRGRGLRAVAQSGWTPGGFGYIGPQDANSTQIGLAYQNPSFECQGITGTEDVSTGAPAPAIVAVNTRFDIYDISGGGGNVLTPCLSGSCPAALNVTKDLVRAGNASGGNACKINNNGWKLPTNRFRAVQTTGTDPMRRFQERLTPPATGYKPIDAMGLPRDNCHFTSYGSACAGGRFGDGNWARGDYFNKYHSGVTLPADVGTWTRYETYLWEMANSRIPNEIASGTGASALWQKGNPVCSTGTPDPARDRRVLQVAIGGNCAELHGASTQVEIDGWVEMFLVEPGVPPPGRGNGDSGNEIYLEVIREVDPGGAAAQVVRRDVPYLVR